LLNAEGNINQLLFKFLTYYKRTKYKIEPLVSGIACRRNW
jgi:hypothetical protein